MNKKISNYILITSLVLTSISGCASNSQQNKEAVQVTQRISELKKEKKTFKNEDDRNKKLNVLKKIVKSEKKYTKDDESKKAYKNSLKEMRQYFTDDYDKRLSDNKIDDLDSITDASQINEKKEQLTILKQDIDQEHNYTLSSDKKYKSYTAEISNLLDSYNVKSDEINKQNENQSSQVQNTTYSSASDALEDMDDTIIQNGKHFENNTLSIDIPDDWEDGTWDISVDENVFQFDRSTGTNILRALQISHMPNTSYPSGGGATIYLLNDVLKEDVNKEWYDNVVGYDGEYGSVEIGRASNGLVVYVQNVGAGAIDDGRGHTISLATITLK